MLWNSLKRNARLLVGLVSSLVILSGCNFFEDADDIDYQIGTEIDNPIAAVEYQYYNQPLTSIDALYSATVDREGLAHKMTLQVGANQSQVGYHFSAFFYAKSNDGYRFKVSASGDSSLYINDELVVDEKLFLAQGYHKVDFWVVPDNGALQPRILVSSSRHKEQDIASGLLHLSLDDIEPLEQASNTPTPSFTGFQYHYYEQENIRLTALDSLNIIESGNSKKIDLSHRNVDENSAFIFQTSINISKEGLYTFRSEAAEYELTVAGNTLFKNPTDSQQRYLSAVWLSPGYYELEYRIINNLAMGQPTLEWAYQGRKIITERKPANESTQNLKPRLTVQPLEYAPIEQLKLLSSLVTAQDEPITNPDESWQDGVNYHYYYSNIPQSIEQIENSFPNVAGLTEGFSLPIENIQYPSANYFESNIEIETEGSYTFYLKHSSYIAGYIGNIPLGDNAQALSVGDKLDSLNVTTSQSAQWRKSSVYLKPGFYNFRLFYHMISAQDTPEVLLAIPGKLRQRLEAFTFKTKPKETLTDLDGDLVPDNEDAFPADPTEWADLDEDGIGDNSDPDIDGDGYLNQDDVFPTDPLEWADLDEDGIGDNSDIDRDGDGVNNDQDAYPDDPTRSQIDNGAKDTDGDGYADDVDAFPLDPTEWQDSDGDGIGDNSDPDRDGDGVNNEHDAYPDDPSKWHDVVKLDLALTQQDESVNMSWSKANNNLIESYRVLRSANQGPFFKLAELSKQTTEYVDKQVTENTVYDYKVEAQGNGELMATSTTQGIFVAFNNRLVKQFVVESDAGVININWLAIPHYSVVVEKRINQDNWQQIADSKSAIHSDTQITHGQIYQYRAKTRRHFNNPLSGTSFVIDGPYTEIISQKAVLPLSVQFTNVDKVTDGVNYWYWHIDENISPIKITGTINNVIEPVKLTFNSANKSLEFHVNTANFELELPIDESHVQWVLNAESIINGVSQRLAAPAILVFQSDTLGAKIELDDSSVMTSEAQIDVTGRLIDDSGIERFTMTSSHFSGTEFGVILHDNGRFTGEVPLEWGENIIELEATDRFGNISHAQAIITRQSEDLPRVKITSHSDGQVVTDQQLMLVAEVTSGLPISDLNIWLNEQRGSLTDIGNDQYTAIFPSISLEEGENLIILKVESTAGMAQHMIKVSYQADLQVLAPVIQVLSPTLGAWVNTKNFEISAIIQSAVQPSVSVNGYQLTAYLQDEGRYRVSYLTKNDETSWQIDASNEAGEDSVALNYQIDVQAPEIQLATQLSVAPSVNLSIETPFRLEGVVRDDQAVTLSLNGEVVPIQPTSTSNTYSFSLSYNLPLNEQRNLTLKATDFAGNSTIKEYIVVNNAQMSAEIIAPSNGKEFVVESDSFNLQFVASVSNVEQASALKLQIDNGAKQDIVAINNLINTTIPMQATSGEHSVSFYAYDNNGVLKAKSTRHFNIQQLEDIPQTVIKTHPDSLQNNLEPNAFISFYFNKAIDSSKLTVQVTETIHGKTYIDETETGASILDNRGETLQDVNRDHMIMQGSIASLPGNHSFAFYPERDFGYGADVKVTINLADEELHRFSFKVRELPTLIDGHIKDNFYTSIPNVRVKLHELNRNEVTNADSAYSFGYLESGEFNIAGGSYTLEVNPERENPLFGNYIRHINIQEGRRNQIPTMILSLINKTVPFSLLQSGQGFSVHANGELELDLAQAQLRFGNGAQSGNMQFSLQDITQIGMQIPDSLPTLWVFSGQPQGVQVNGNVGVAIKAASLLGSYAYLPEDGQYTPIVGRASDTNQLDVVGVAQRQGLWMRSVGDVKLENLDYVGFAIVGFDKQVTLEEYANGNIELIQLKAELNP
ncbi:thrombospondin type 3 repeat-containing protein [Shewanella sp. 10N.286.52.B9]|uniref:thrombospondin type 3 repeat-containing protein n=1 Tax=Shewanella sp. 10N.286.52.B9 TaxID=1880837 RepID=UPI000C84062C|nr:thrombospondin type 3 repeat-containing protein [Shewanella sp. 10N.286.52.B9]PMG39254.1 hypothetical protein BCU91_15465 [Shewanella sp. 10N.286.52.B9]